MELIVRDRILLMEMGAKSYNLVISEHSPAKYVESLLAITEGSG